MSFTNTNYQSKLSPTMTENWLVQIFKNTTSSVSTTDTPDFRFSFSETTYNSQNYYPAILNKPSISYSLDLKGFTTKTGSVTLNLANINLDGTTLLELLGNDTINGQVNILSQIDNDNTAANALQIFSGRVSSFAYRNNTIVLSLVSNRPFQNVSIPQGKTSNSDNPQYNNKIQPLVFGDYTANTNFVNGQDVYACPFLKNDGANFMYIIPEGTSGSDKLEFYDKGMKRFVELVNTDTTIATVDSVKVLKVPTLMTRQFKMLPDDVTATIVGSGVSLTAGSLDNAYNGNTGNSATYANTVGFSSESKGVVFKLQMPQVTGKITAITLGLSGTYSQTITGSPSGTDGAFFNLSTELQSNFGKANSTDIELVGTSSSGDKVDRTNVALPTSTNIASILTNNALPDELYLSFRFNAEGDDISYSDFNIILSNVFVTITATNDLVNEPIASQEFNAGIEKVYLGRDVLTEGFTAYSSVATLTDLDNPVAIHRQLLHSIINVADSDSDAKIENSGYKSVAELRDSTLTSPTSTHWKTRLALHEQEELESIMEQLQYEGCFFFEFSPQAQQTSISGVNELRYFTIADSVTANVDLSQNDISGYELGITPVSDLETNIVVNYKKHPAENQYLKQDTFTSSTSGSVHSTIFDNASHQKQEINLDFLIDAVDDVVGSRNSSWINFRKSLFGEYKTTVNATLVNPEKYAMLQVGDFIDFGEITFSELGTPFDEISDTFDSFIAMPTRLFKDAWSGKKFIITNLKRQVGKISIQTREV
jgi:hypothetical protein